MMSNNKVLTVSYGTFSCTLEGFEDSFGTMKAIAEYFRDLAAEDRYFGAVPPQPDAEMLARIAEREVARRVDARSEDGQIVLSTQAPEPDASPMPPAAAAVTAAAPIVADLAMDQAGSEPMADDALDVAAIAAAVEESAAEPVALADTSLDLDQDVAVETPAPQIDEADVPETAEAVEGEAPAVYETNAAEEELTEDPVSEDDIVEAALVEDEIVEAELVEDETPPAPASDINDKLDRIRAVVAQTQAADDDDFSEDEHAEDLIDIPDVAGFEDEADGAGDDAVEAMLDARAETLADDAVSGDDTLDADKMLLAGLDDVADGDDDNLFDGEADGSGDAPRARIIKVKRSEMEAAIAAGDIDGPADLARMVDEGAFEEVPIEGEAADTSLSDEDEQELLRELAEVEVELAPSDDDSAVAASHGEIADDDVTRLLAETDEQMDEPEGSRSRQAFRQLRAAVVARNSDEDLKKASDGEGDDSAYRSDLAEVVRPRRPSASGEGTARPRTPAAPPLKLVAEQRVDIDPTEAPAATAVTPRRVSADQAAKTVDEDGGFAEFASEMGASALPDLLEAAAAYMAFVEGRDDFSRPQLMHKVRALDPDDFRREDGLRSFGQLLRDGKIEKLEGGRFAATGEIGFKPRRAAG